MAAARVLTMLQAAARLARGAALSATGPVAGGRRLASNSLFGRVFGSGVSEEKDKLPGDAEVAVPMDVLEGTAGDDDGWTAPADVRAAVEDVVKRSVPGSAEVEAWEEIPLHKNGVVKFEVINDLVDVFRRDVPAADLQYMRTPADIVAFFESPPLPQPEYRPTFPDVDFETLPQNVIFRPIPHEHFTPPVYVKKVTTWKGRGSEKAAIDKLYLPGHKSPDGPVIRRFRRSPQPVRHRLGN